MVESDNVKKFIQDNLDDFNLEQPSKKVWKGIEASNKPKNFRQYFGIAASLLFLISAGTYFLFQNDNETNSIENPLVTNEVYVVPEEVKDIEQFYAIQVNQKIKEAERFEDSKDLLDEVENLKLEFEELKSDMGIGADREKVLEAMIDNYRTRLTILEDLLEELDRDNDVKKIKENEEV